jgi:hypothetical protein
MAFKDKNITQAKASNGGDKDPAVAYDYAMYMTEGDEWRADANGGQLYKWNGVIWEAKSWKYFETHTTLWLASRSPELATKSRRDGSMAIALDFLCDPAGGRVMPETTKRNILAFRNGWLEIFSDGKIKRISPDKSLGVHCSIDANILSTIPVGGEYKPRKLPDNSRFVGFVKRILPDEDVRAAVQEFCGYSFVTSLSLELAQFWLGTGSNGKSTLEQILSHFHASRRFEIPDDTSTTGNLSGLVGATLAVGSDTSTSSRIDSSFFKKLSSGQIIKVRDLYRNGLDYRAVAKPLYLCNDMPRFTEGLDHAHRRRISAIHFDATIAGAEKEIGLAERIIEQESLMFLDWCLDGAARVCRQKGFTENASLDAQKTRALANSTPFTAWCSVRKPRPVRNPQWDTAFVKMKDDVFADFESFLEEQGMKGDKWLKTTHQMDFFKQLADRFPETREWGRDWERRHRVDIKDERTGKKEKKPKFYISLVFDADLELTDDEMEKARDIEKALRADPKIFDQIEAELPV